MIARNTLSIPEIMDYLVENRMLDLPPKALSDVFDGLIWCLSDNGAEINEVRKNWLYGNDLFKIEVALSMTETFPFEEKSEMISAFRNIVENWPHLQDRCDKIIRAWEAQLEN